MDTVEAMKSLLAEPDKFLKYYPVLIAGAPAPTQNAVNTSPYTINKVASAPGPNPAHAGATRPGLFGYKREISSFKMMPGGGPTGASKTAIVVPMINHDSDDYGCLNLHGQLATMPYYKLDGSGDGLMCTGALSGCCFVWLAQGADLWCAHVKPNGSEGVRLQTTLATSGRFAQAPHAPLSTFGRNDYPNVATVVGVRKAGTWKLFAQTGPGGMKTLTGAYQIYPGARRPL